MPTETTNQLPLEQAVQPQIQEQPKAESSTTVAKKEEYTPERTRTAISKLPPQLGGIAKLMAKPRESFRDK